MSFALPVAYRRTCPPSRKTCAARTTFWHCRSTSHRCGLHSQRHSRRGNPIVSVEQAMRRRKKVVACWSCGDYVRLDLLKVHVAWHMPLNPGDTIGIRRKEPKGRRGRGRRGQRSGSRCQRLHPRGTSGARASPPCSKREPGLTDFRKGASFH